VEKGKKEKGDVEDRKVFCVFGCIHPAVYRKHDEEKKKQRESVRVGLLNFKKR
jgi:hypothetical protein